MVWFWEGGQWCTNRSPRRRAQPCLQLEILGTPAQPALQSFFLMKDIQVRQDTGTNRDARWQPWITLWQGPGCPKYPVSSGWGGLYPCLEGFVRVDPKGSACAQPCCIERCRPKEWGLSILSLPPSGLQWRAPETSQQEDPGSLETGADGSMQFSPTICFIMAESHCHPLIGFRIPRGQGRGSWNPLGELPSLLL